MSPPPARPVVPTVPTALLAMPDSRLGCWLAAIRPKTLTIAVTPVVVGTALAWRDADRIAPAVLLATLAGALLIQVGTNLHNDAADHERGADWPASRLGPPRATAQGWLGAREVRFGAMASFLIAMAVGCSLIAVGGWPVAALGLVCVLAGLSYSGGPRPISHSPFGELFVLVFFGLAAVGGTYYLQCATLTPVVLLAGLAVGAPAAAVLVVNNHRDREEDGRDGRMTLTIVLGRRMSAWAYTGFVLAPFAMLPALAQGSGAWGWTALVCAPWALWLARRVHEARDADGAMLNRLLADTARYQLALGGSLAAGWLTPLGLSS